MNYLTLIANLTEKYSNAPYSLSVESARAAALFEASRVMADRVPAYIPTGSEIVYGD